MYKLKCNWQNVVNQDARYNTFFLTLLKIIPKMKHIDNNTLLLQKSLKSCESYHKGFHTSFHLTYIHKSIFAPFSYYKIQAKTPSSYGALWLRDQPINKKMKQSKLQCSRDNLLKSCKYSIKCKMISKV